MKIWYKIIMLIIFILSIIWFVSNISTYMHQRDWATATATITLDSYPQLF